MSGFEHDDALRGMLRRARIENVDDSGSQQQLDLSGFKNDKPRKVVRIGSHGIASNPPKESEGVIISLGGGSDRQMALGFEHREHRPKDLPAGTSVLYDDKGNVIRMYGADGLQIEAKLGKIYVKPPDGQNVYLGGNGVDGVYSKVVTSAGAALNVFARVS